MRLPIFLCFWSTLCFFVSCTNTSTPTDDQPTDSTSTSIEQPETTPTTPTFTGTYTLDDQDGESGGGYLVIEKVSDDSLKFELDINNGAPNFHSGTATGMLSLVDQTATFITTEYDGECKITFAFEGNQVTVEQVNGSDFACGFGQGVAAHGVYTKQGDEAIFRYEGGM